MASLLATATPTTRVYRVSAERRAHPRVKISVGGRIMFENRTECAATTTEASVKALVFTSDRSPRPGERVIGYFDGIGRVEGVAERVQDGMTVLSLGNTLRKREKLAGQLTWLANREVLNLPEDRRHERIVPRDPRVTVRLAESAQAEVLLGALIDISHGGAAVSVQGNFKKDDEVVIGTTPARVIRAFDGGFACEFKAPIPDIIFSVDLKL